MISIFERLLRKLARGKELLTPDERLEYVRIKIKVDPDVFSLYAQREPTRREHMEEIRQEYNYRNFSIHEYRFCSHHLFTCAQENTNTTFLINSAIDYLRKRSQEHAGLAKNYR